MKKINKDWLLLILALAAVAIFLLSTQSCMTAKRINRLKNLYCKDSVSVVIKDRIVKIPIYYNDSSMLEIWLKCDSLGNVYYTNWKQSEGKYSDLQAALKDNVLTVKNYVTIYDTARVTVTDTVKFQQANKTTNVLTTAQKNQIKAFWWLLAIVVVSITVFILYKIYRLKIKSLLSKVVG